MTERESHIAKMIGDRIKMKDPKAEVILFGSHARVQANDESDWDILILIDKPKPNRLGEKKYRDEIFQIELELGVAISTIIYSKFDWESRYVFSSLYKNIQQEGVKIA